MLSETRRAKILDVVRQQGSAEVVHLSKTLGVCEATIRRDLNSLEKKGLLQRTHGGAIASIQTGVGFEPPYIIQKDKFIKEKQGIGAKALEFISNGDTLILDASTTTLQIARQMQGKNDLTIITNSMDIINELANKKGTMVISTGGTLNKRSMSLVGPTAEQFLKEIHADKLFLGISAISFKEGITTPNIQESQTKKAMIQAAREIIGVADSSKFGKINLFNVAPVTVLHKIITDKGIQEKDRKFLEKKGVKVIIV